MTLTFQDGLDAVEAAMRSLIGPQNNRGYSPSSSYSYHIYLPKIALEKGYQFNTDEHRKATQTLADAAHIFVLRGLLRMGVVTFGGQSGGEGSIGFGFSITSNGLNWLQKEQPPEIPIGNQDRMVALFQTHRNRFGQGYMRRASESVDCYQSRNYLACCVMAGAAAEGILLQMAVKKLGDEESVLKKYNAANGRSWLENQIIGSAPDRIKSTFIVCMDLLKYWRDNSAHGAITDIAEQEAYISLVTLARFAQFSDSSWNILTVPKTQQ